MNELVLIETKIKEGDAALNAADKHKAKAVEMKIAAGKLYAEARDMCFQEGVKWTETCKLITSRSYTQVKQMLRIAGATDPYAAEAFERQILARVTVVGVCEKKAQQKKMSLAADSDNQLAQELLHIEEDHLEDRCFGTVDSVEFPATLGFVPKHYCRKQIAERLSFEENLQNFPILGYVLLAQPPWVVGALIVVVQASVGCCEGGDIVG